MNLIISSRAFIQPFGILVFLLRKILTGIIIDRFIYSTIAYQSIGMGINFKIVNTLNKFLLGNIKPSFIFLLLFQRGYTVFW